MNINWYGQGCVGLKGKDVEIIIDPFLTTTTGLKLPSLKDKIVLVGSFGVGKDFGKESTKIIDSPGEYEFSEIFVYGINAENNYPKIIYQLTFEDISVVHLGSILEVPDEEIVNELSDTDILFVPVGGEDVLSSSKAAKLVSQINPKIVIPIYYQIPGLKIKLETADKFIKETGLKAAQEEEKLTIKKKDFGEETQLIILKP
ncbi:MAG: MBL fold metallo-hydrolase [Patescibacteria group bacterium]